MVFLLDQNLPREYVVRKFYELGYNAQYNRSNDTYFCGCPICREGKSLGKKTRCYYLPDRNLIYCFNCGWSSKPIKWIKEAGGLCDTDIYNEVHDADYNVVNLDKKKELDYDVLIPDDYNNGLPSDAINLMNELQVAYYKDNGVIKKAKQYIHDRRLDTAVNKAKSYYISLEDNVHRNRLIIPFYDRNGKIIFYQSRAFGGNVDGYREDVKYLSKKDSDRSLYGVDNVKEEIPYLFLLEGPIDASFVINGLGVAGINLSQKRDLTPRQKKQLQSYQYTHKCIWVMDSQWIDKTAKEKTKLLLSEGASVFFWTKDIGSQYKDFNELCIDKKLDEVPYHYVVNHALHGNTGLLKFNLEMNK